MSTTNMEVKTLAELKRALTVGTTYYLTYSSIRTKPVTAPEWRKIVRRQTNAVIYECAELQGGKVGWLYFPKASEFRAIPGGWEFNTPTPPQWPDQKPILLRFKFSTGSGGPRT